MAQQETKFWVVNDSDIQATVVLRNKETKAISEIFIQPFSRAQVLKEFEVHPLTYNNHPRVKVL
jgi:hypothetical protein